MTQCEIIKKNLEAVIEALTKSKPSMDVLNQFEGWGRCTNLKDTFSEESKLFKSMLERYKNDIPDADVTRVYTDAQHATETSFYTPSSIAKSICEGAHEIYKKLNGKEAKLVCDPSAGTGSFLDHVVRGQVVACEVDYSTYLVLKARMDILYFKKNVFNQGFEDFYWNPQCDLFISNIPFGNVAVYDKNMHKEYVNEYGLSDVYLTCKKKIHNYFFIKSMMMLRDGGIIAFITSRGFLSSNDNAPYRAEMLKHGRVVDIIRLPDNMFPTVNVGTDLIIYQRINEEQLRSMPKQQIDMLFLNGWPETVGTDNEVFSNQQRKYVLDGCVEKIKKNQYGKQVVVYAMGSWLKRDERSKLIADAITKHINKYDLDMKETVTESLVQRSKRAMGFLFFFFNDEEPKKREPEPMPEVEVVEQFDEVEQLPDAEPVQMSAEDALLQSLNIRGVVDMGYMTEISGLDKVQLVSDLKGQVFLNPITGLHEEKDRFLCGNVVDKARKAVDYMDCYKNGEREEVEYALSQLQGARPEQLSFADIDIKFGNRWIPIQYYQEFISYLYDGELEPDEVNITYVKETDSYVPDFCSCYCKRSHLWEVNNSDMKDMIMKCMVGESPNFTKTIREDGKEKSVRDEEACHKADDIFREIKTEWDNWINDPKRAEYRAEMERIYNDTYNSEVRPEYDGTFQTFPGLDLKGLGIEDLYNTQKNVVWMLKRNYGGVAWHEVGTGKTLIMCVTSHEMKRCGFIKKPLIICMKATIGQVVETYHKAYPDAEILAPTNADLGKNRQAFLERVKDGDFDCIIMTHEQFERIPAAKRTEERLLQEEIDGLDDALQEIGGRAFRNRILRGLQKRRDKMRFQLRELQEAIRSGQDGGFDFSDLGIDHILVDEYQQFKNLAFATRNERVAGIGNPAGSQRAWKLLTAIRDIQYRMDRDLCATFLSGTIVTNSLTELYIIFKYLRPRALAEQNIHSFDAWAANYTEKKTDVGIDVVGRIQFKEKFSSYVNLPELGQFFRQITDYRTASMVGIDRPEEVQHFESAPPTPQQQTMIERMVKFVGKKNWSLLGIQREQPANMDTAMMLIATNLARQVSLDTRMLDNCKTFGDEENNKIRRCAKNIVRMYRKYDEHKGTQFVFNDISTKDDEKWNMQTELAEVLVKEYGIPENEISFINDVSSDTARKKLFERMNNGEVRILMGSTTKLGTGVNAQERAVAIHHLDIPWRPSDLEQRNGRAIRKGNQVKFWGDNKVEVFIYATERTLDQYKFDLLKSKQMFISQLMSGTLGLRRIDESVMQDGDKAVSYAEFLSILSGNQDLLKKAKLDAKIMAAEKQKNAYRRERDNAEKQLQCHERETKAYLSWIAKLNMDLKACDVTEETIPTVRGKKFTKLEDAGKALIEIGERNGQTDYTEVGKCGVFKIAVKLDVPEIPSEVNPAVNRFYLIGPSGQYYRVCQGASYTGTLTKGMGQAEAAKCVWRGLERAKVESGQKQVLIDKYKSEEPALKAVIAKQWEGQEELDAMYAELNVIRQRIEEESKKVA